MREVLYTFVRFLLFRAVSANATVSLETTLRIENRHAADFETVATPPVGPTLEPKNPEQPPSIGDGAEPAPRSPEILEARWFPIDELPELQFETAEAMAVLARQRLPR